MDDDILQGWTLDPDTRIRMRLDQVRKLLDTMAWHEAVLEAEELLDEEPQHVPALELLAKAQLGMMDAEGAVLTWEQVHALDPTPSADRLASLAMARFDTTDLVGAVEAARESIRLDSGRAEAHFVLGLALERLPGRSVEAAQALVAASRLDPLAYPFPIRLDAKGWEQALTTAMLQVTPEVRALWEGVPVRLPDYPDMELLRSSQPHLSPRLPGMYQGNAPSLAEEPVEDPWSEKPDGLLLFTQNLARVHSLDELVERLADVLEQEALVWVGEDPWGPDDVELEEM
mgnify:CR=1 FL=1